MNELMKKTEVKKKGERNKGIDEGRKEKGN